MKTGRTFLSLKEELIPGWQATRPWNGNWLHWACTKWYNTGKTQLWLQPSVLLHRQLILVGTVGWWASNGALGKAGCILQTSSKHLGEPLLSVPLLHQKGNHYSSHLIWSRIGISWISKKDCMRIWLLHLRRGVSFSAKKDKSLDGSYETHDVSYLAISQSS